MCYTTPGRSYQKFSSFYSITDNVEKKTKQKRPQKPRPHIDKSLYPFVCIVFVNGFDLAKVGHTSFSLGALPRSIKIFCRAESCCRPLFGYQMRVHGVRVCCLLQGVLVRCTFAVFCLMPTPDVINLLGNYDGLQ